MTCAAVAFRSTDRPVIVISAVNLVEGGTLSILSDCLAWADETLTRKYDVFALVHRASTFDCKKVRLIEMPDAKRSWLRRLWHEYRLFKPLSETLQPLLWLSLHDMTPNVVAKRRAVYCHNASPFYRITVREAWHEPTLFLFNLFYKHLYRINIRCNDFVIVQQQWLKTEFERLFQLPHVVVAHPDVPTSVYGEVPANELCALPSSRKIRLVYPAFPRAFKNFELLAEAMIEYSRRGNTGLEILITVDGTENRYARWIRTRYGSVEGLRFIGRVSRSELFALYAEVDGLVFPSKLETWGLPLTEFKSFGKPILAADLPYARETVGAYERCSYFPATDPRVLVERLIEFREGRLHFPPPSTTPPNESHVIGWGPLFDILLPQNEEKHGV